MTELYQEDVDTAFFPLDPASFTYDLIPAACAGIKAQMRAKDFTPGECQVWLGEVTDYVTIYNNARCGDVHRNAPSGNWIEKCTPDGIARALNAVWSYWANLKAVKELERDDFLNRLGQLIDEARRVDIPLDFINPLTEAMARLSENVLEHHRTAEETV